MCSTTSSAAVPQLYDLDDGANFSSCCAKLLDSRTKNFALDFDHSYATCAVDLDCDQIRAILPKSEAASSKTRWLNFWGGLAQRDTIKAIASHYGISPRLMSLLCPGTIGNPTVTIKRHQTARENSRFTCSPKIPVCEFDYAEKAFATSVQNSPSHQARASKEEMRNRLGKGSVMEDLWHFCSVDWGQRYFHIGYNSLYTVPGVDIDAGSSKPAALRVWTSLILCDDGTIISVFEDRDVLADLKTDILKVTRQNALNVFRHLSALHMGDSNQETMMTVNVRNSLPQPATPTTASEGASLLLYYLFDDWVASYGLVTQSENPYRKELEQLRTQMFQRPKVELIESLHLIGRRLNVLKLMYQSYELIGQRVVEHDRMVRDQTVRQDKQRRQSTQHSQSSTLLPPPDQALSLPATQTSSTSPTSVTLSISSLVRFERLSDRIKLYALNEIAECLSEKDSLVFMSFNLISLKEAQAVEKLTRITIVLAKATIMFLPVSLMTGYFSVQIADLQELYTVRTYWTCFGVVVVASLLFLVVFGVVSERVEGKVVYRSLTRTIWDRSKKEKSV